MLPYVTKAKEDKMGIVVFDDVFRDSIRGGDIDVRTQSPGGHSARTDSGHWYCSGPAQ
jgi:hypothetical protein